MSCRKFLQLNFPRSHDFLQLTLIFYKSYFLKSTFYKSHSSFLQVLILKKSTWCTQNFRLRRCKHPYKSFTARVKTSKKIACGARNILTNPSRQGPKSQNFPPAAGLSVLAGNRLEATRSNLSLKYHLDRTGRLPPVAERRRRKFRYLLPLY